MSKLLLIECFQDKFVSQKRFMSGTDAAIAELSIRIAQNLPIKEHFVRAWVPSTLRKARLRRTLANKFPFYKVDVQFDALFTAADALCALRHEKKRKKSDAGCYCRLIVKQK